MKSTVPEVKFLMYRSNSLLLLPFFLSPFSTLLPISAPFLSRLSSFAPPPPHELHFNFIPTSFFCSYVPHIIFFSPSFFPPSLPLPLISIPMLLFPHFLFISPYFFSSLPSSSLHIHSSAFISSPISLFLFIFFPSCLLFLLPYPSPFLLSVFLFSFPLP